MRLVRGGVKRRKPDRQGNNDEEISVSFHTASLREESPIDRAITEILQDLCEVLDC